MKVPERMCIVTRTLKPKNQLLRLVKVNGTVVVDEKQKLQGRGIWVSKSSEILPALKNKKLLNKVFKCEVSQDVLEQVEQLCQQN